MNNQISNKISFVMILLLVLFFGNYIFKNTLGQTLQLKQEYEDLVILSNNDIDYSTLLVNVKNQLTELDKLIIDKDVHAGQIQQLLMNQIELLKKEHNINITHVPAPHQYQQGQYTVITGAFELEGQFIDLLRLIYQLESQFDQANLASVKFKLKRNLLLNKKELYATIYFQNIKKMYNLIGLFILILSLSSCKDFFEEDISENNIVIITPSDNAIFTNLNVTFDWEDMDEVINYRMLLGSPNLSNPSAFYMDSSVTLSALVLSLDPGDYEWKVRAENNSSETNYSSIMHLKIDSSYSLSSQSIVLYTPENNFYTNNDNFNFSWQSLYAADNYQVVIKTGIDWNTGSVLLDTVVQATNINNPLSLTEGNYIWSVKGVNNLPSETTFSTKRLFNVDLTSPNSPNLNLPNTTINSLNTDSLYLFDWSRAANNGTAQSSLYDSVFIYSDTIQYPIYSYGSLQEDTTLTLPNFSGVYYWNVKTYDQAGNFSSFPYFMKFTVL